jgi:hypothetical protein
MNKSKFLWVILIVLALIAGWLIWSDKLSFFEPPKPSLNQEVSEFHEFFIRSVLQTEGEIDFETRLKLEGKVRALNDPEILGAWNNFVNAPSEEEAQIILKQLLLVLVKKTRD